MKKDSFEVLKKEAKHIGMLFFLCLIIFKIAFFKDSLLVVFKIVLSIFWMFTLPGFFLMFYWHENLGFAERSVIGTLLGLAIMGMTSYYLGLLGINIKYNTIILPLVILFAGIPIIQKKFK